MGTVAGASVALIFYMRMRIEERLGKAGTRQSSLAGFETEDVLYLLPLVTLFGGLTPFLLAAGVGAPLFALLVVADFVRVTRRAAPAQGISPAPNAAEIDLSVRQATTIFLNGCRPKPSKHGRPRPR